MRYCGVIEGFYGTPWSHADRLGILDYLGAHRMNSYQYAPKDDLYHREKWREPYPPEKLAELGELVDQARANDVDFTFALSPGLSIRYTSEADYEALIAKFEALYELGVRSFNIPFDDIDYGTWHCSEDVAEYDNGPAAAGRAQSDVLNRVQREWIAAKADVGPLHMVPTEYYDNTETEYKKALREHLDAAIVVHWTGIGVVPGSITQEQAARARTVFGHDILLWDNYPVNDYISGRIPLGPYSGREPGIAEEIVGVLSNPMNQATVSRLALFSFGEFGADASTYDSTAAWERALAELADDSDVVEALKLFADVNWYDGTLHTESAPRLAKALDAFWDGWNAGRTDAAASELRPVLEALGHAPKLIREGVTLPAFAAEARAWLDATEFWAGAAQAALDLLLGLEQGDGETSWERWQRLASLTRNAKATRDSRLPHSKTYPRVADGVLDDFVTEATHQFEEYVGVGVDRPVVTTSLRIQRGNPPTYMVDGQLDTYFRSAAAPESGDFVQLDLKRARPIGDIAVLMASSNAPDDHLKSGVLEHSADGASWTELARGTTQEVSASAPAGTEARFVRYRAAENDQNRLLVREFAVEVLDAVWTQVSGVPEPIEHSALAFAADDNLETEYVAARAPEAEDALLVELSAERLADGVCVLQAQDSAGTAEVDVRIAAEWHHAGALTGPYTALAFEPAMIDAVRLRWNAGAVAPWIAEVVLRYVS